MHVGTLEVYKCKTWMEESVGMSVCRHLEVYKCKTLVVEGAGMLWHFIKVLTC